LENNKILAAILRVKPSKEIMVNRKSIERQELLLSNISRSQKQSLKSMVSKRQRHIGYQRQLFPSILDYQKSKNEQLGLEAPSGEFQDGYEFDTANQMEFKHDHFPHKRSNTNLTVSKSYNLGTRKSKNISNGLLN
jgi:hypothetical protein